MIKVMQSSDGVRVGESEWWRVYRPQNTHGLKKERDRGREGGGVKEWESKRDRERESGWVVGRDKQPRGTERAHSASLRRSTQSRGAAAAIESRRTHSCSR